MKEVLENYPDAQQAPEANEAELTKIVDKYKKSGIDGTRELAKYHREFVAVATALKNQGTMSAVQVAKAYVRVLPNGLKNQLETRLQVQIPTKQKGIAYTLPQIRSAIEFLISDALTPFATEDFRVGDHTVAPEPKNSYGTPKTESKMKEETEDTVVSHLTKQLLALTQVVNKMIDGQTIKLPFDSSIGSTDTQVRKPKLCYWDGCSNRTMNNCPDLAEWVRKRTVERNARGHVVLKGGGCLPDEERFNQGPIKQRFEKYFEEYPAARALILDIPLNHDVGPNHQLGEPDFAVSAHTTYTLNGYQGLSMLTSATSYLVQDESDNTAINRIKEMIYKMETRRSANEQSKDGKGRMETKADSSNHDISQYPQPAQTVPKQPEIPVKPPKPIIGTLPKNYVPPQERTLGVPPKDDNRNYQYRSPVESEEATNHLIEAGLCGKVIVDQQDLMAAAPNYCRKVKELCTGRCVGLEGALLEEVNTTYLLQLLHHTAVPKYLAADIFFNDFAEAKEGDGFYVAKDSVSLRGLNTTIGERVVHCVTNSGCSIVAMSDATCNALGIAFDPTKQIGLQSANGRMDWSLGLAKDVPFRFGEVLAFLQAHIVDSPAYDVLIGRPFEVLMQANVQNFASGDQHITLTDPNSYKSITFPTIPREPP
ncbi:hypothetical protein DFH05DRAFT_1520266 [Lentinula detonsa]|uniref:Uncharacterized protein n=1 Tax=Lentinula detonsa TaxID=2804962 RepID=A0A9W8P7W1_9AGAR|nr:hypothetical protein DFH05DRAFT_1520266 [Lentinula detonsa]